jgi:hypothetical protein
MDISDFKAWPGTFTCAGCHQTTRSGSGIEWFDGKHYVVCPLCRAENEIVQGGAGPGLTFTVFGILKRKK